MRIGHYQIELHLKSGAIVCLRLCSPHDSSVPLNSIDEQKEALGFSDHIANPTGKVLTGITVSGEYAMIPDHEIEHLRIARSSTNWGECHLDQQVFSTDGDGESADVIRLDDKRTDDHYHPDEDWNGED